MSFSKAQDLIELAIMANTRHGGVTLEEIRDRFGISHRTAQRMVQALQDTFDGVEELTRPDRRRAWRLSAPVAPALLPRGDEALEALDFALSEARDSERHRHVRMLQRLRETVLQQMGGRARAAETDAEAVLHSLARVTRPGPKVRVSPEVVDAVYDALRGPYRLSIRYGTDATDRLVDPQGVLLGPRSYLVALLPGTDALRHFRLDRILAAECTDEIIALDPDFSIEAHAAEAFASYHDPAQVGPVVWRFSPRAAEAASGFRFHPDQEVTTEPDGSLTVRFAACGWLEMAWFLYQWGNEVEVLEPAGLAALVHPARREFDALP